MANTGHKLLSYLEKFLDHPFQNVRERIASTLINIFENDINFDGENSIIYSPIFRDLFERKKKELLILQNDDYSNHGK